MSNKKENSSNFSSTINKDSKNEEDNDIYSKTRQRVGIKNKINNNQAGRATVSVPLSSFNSISHNASFQSKVLFFNGGKPRKFQHIPYAHERIPEDNKQKNTNYKIDKKDDKKIEKKLEKKIEKKEDKKEDKKIEKKEEKKEDKNVEKNIDSNININQIINSEKQNQIIKNKINNNEDNKNIINKEDEFDIKINSQKKNTIYVPFNKASTFSLDYKIPGFSKLQKEDGTKTNEENKVNKIIKLKSLDEQWSFQKILLDYNILDFTSKFYYF